MPIPTEQTNEHTIERSSHTTARDWEKKESYKTYWFNPLAGSGKAKKFDREVAVFPGNGNLIAGEAANGNEDPANASSSQTGGGRN
ncbi:glutamine synthetase [Anopheles sinensis]|uniref:Glutamine synthetase n=1 Tax=Anopheles sinensis TaxID=74873 RepID=A0A084VZ27_ANOSI|nr:glutamine synthetase [Anopheles sinensis]